MKIQLNGSYSISDLNSELFHYGYKVNMIGIGKEEPKLMTREEAVEILSKKVFEFSCDPIEAANRWLNGFETLGLIKFKEEKKEIIRIKNFDHKTYSNCNLDEVVVGLKEKGYTVTKNG